MPEPSVPPCLDDPVPEEDQVRRCRDCGCDDDHACAGGCWWVDIDLCSTCAEKHGEVL
jgi:hypothetical protein